MPSATWWAHAAMATDGGPPGADRQGRCVGNVQPAVAMYFAAVIDDSLLRIRAQAGAATHVGGQWLA